MLRNSGLLLSILLFPAMVLAIPKLSELQCQNQLDYEKLTLETSQAELQMGLRSVWEDESFAREVLNSAYDSSSYSKEDFFYIYSNCRTKLPLLTIEKVRQYSEQYEKIEEQAGCAIRVVEFADTMEELNKSVVKYNESLSKLPPDMVKISGELTLSEVKGADKEFWQIYSYCRSDEIGFYKLSNDLYDKYRPMLSQMETFFNAKFGDKK